MRRRLPRLAALALLVAITAVAVAAAARPGGGNYYSGGDHDSGGGGGGGGDGGGAALFFLLQLCIEHPVVGIPLLVIVLGVMYWQQKNKGAEQGWQTTPAYVPPPPPPPRKLPRAALDALRQDDPEFSTVLFEDFLYSLYTAFHEARGGSTAMRLEPYLVPHTLQMMHAARRRDVKNVIVGAMSLAGVEHADRGGERWVVVTVAYEANFTEVDDAGREHGFYAQERWRLARKASARSRSPDKSNISQCPNCGGALEALQGNVCAYCRQTLAPGQFDWCVEGIEASYETRPPVLTHEGPEVGTDWPTVVTPGTEERYRQLCARDPAFAWPALQARLGLIFDRFQAGWVQRDWRLLRPYLSDVMFQSQLYWIEEFRRQKLVNRTDGARISDIRIASVASDKYFDAITVRLYATGADFTTDETGKVVSGSPHKLRYYSEYWTLIRGSGVHRQTKASPECPNCGAPLAIGMAGNCEHCRAKVTSGQFDWVLSRIEQDESYTG